MTPSPAPTPRISPSLLQPCPDLPALQGGTGAQLLLWGVEVADLYGDCKDRQAALAGAVAASKAAPR